MRKLLVLMALLFVSTEALAQATTELCVRATPTGFCQAVNSTTPLPVDGVFSGTVEGFGPNANYTTLTATAASSASTALPAGNVVAFQNLSSVDVSCVLTIGAATATTNKLIVRAGATVYYTVGSHLNTACINQSGAASNVVALAGGDGLGTAFGGASAGGGGGGGAVTVADGADVTEGAIADAAVAAGAAGTVNAHLRSISRDVMTVNTWAGGTLAAMAAYGTPPTGLVPGVNAFVTNTQPPGQAAMAASSPVVIASNQSPVSSTPGTLAGGATFVSGTTAAMTGTTSTQVIALVTSQRIYVTRIACKGDPANAVATRVQIRDGSAGTVLDTLSVAASGGGEQGTGATPLFWTTAGTALFAQNVTTGASVICTASGYSG